MTALLLIPDGAAGALSGDTAPTCSALPHTATVSTIPAGLPVASEVAIPSLLGVAVTRAPARGAVEAVSVGLEVGPAASAWRLDVAGMDATSSGVPGVAATLERALDATVRHLRADRFAVVGPVSWLRDGRDDHRSRIAADALDRRVHLWGGGTAPDVPPAGRRTAVVAAPTGAAAGIARLIGADLVVPDGATGFPGTDLGAKAAAAAQLLRAARHEVVVVHVGAADEAGHAGDAELQRECVTAFDRQLVRPLLDIADELGVPVAVAPDHGTDPSTRRHVGGPVTVHATVPLPRTLAAPDLLTHVIGGAAAEVAA